MTDQELKECIAEVKYSAIPKPSKKKILDVLHEKLKEFGSMKAEVLPLQAIMMSENIELHKKMCVQKCKDMICDEVKKHIAVSFVTDQNEPEKVYVDARLDVVRNPIQSVDEFDIKAVSEWENLEARR